MVIKFAQRSNAIRMPQHRQEHDCRGGGADGLTICVPSSLFQWLSPSPLAPLSFSMP